MTPRIARALGAACALLAAGCSSSSSSDGAGAVDGTPSIPPTRLATLRRCMFTTASPGAPEGASVLASGYDLVRAYRACRDPAAEADDAATFRAAIAGFAAPAEGAWPHYAMSLGTGTTP